MRLIQAMALGAVVASGTAAMAAGKAKAPAQLKLSERDNGRSVDMKKGQKVTVSLPQNASTGYRWKVVQTPRALGYPQESYKASGPVGIVGGGGTLKLTWNTKSQFASPGTYKIKLAYGRGWEKSPLKTFSFSIKLKK